MLAHKTIRKVEVRVRSAKRMLTEINKSHKYYGGPDRKTLQALLRDHGFKSTEGRLELLSLLKSTGRLISFKDISAKLPGWLDEANVYRALEAFVRAGLLSRSDLRQGDTYYEMLHGHHHHHVICSDCGTTEDVEECADKNLETRVLRNTKKFAAINTHALEFFGTCNSCVNK